MDTDTDDGHVIDADLYVSAEEAARLAGVSARTVRRWITAGDVQAADGPKGRTVSVSDVRRRSALGHDRSRPPRPSAMPRMDMDMDGHAVMSAVSASIAPQLTEITEQIERLTREIGEANIRAAVAELRIEQERAARLVAERERDELRSIAELRDRLEARLLTVQAERDDALAEVELLREIQHAPASTEDTEPFTPIVEPSAGETTTTPPVASPAAPGSTDAPPRTQDTLQPETPRPVWWRRLIRRS